MHDERIEYENKKRIRGVSCKEREDKEQEGCGVLEKERGKEQGVLPIQSESSIDMIEMNEIQVLESSSIILGQVHVLSSLKGFQSLGLEEQRHSLTLEEDKEKQSVLQKKEHNAESITISFLNEKEKKVIKTNVLDKIEEGESRDVTLSGKNSKRLECGMQEDEMEINKDEDSLHEMEKEDVVENDEEVMHHADDMDSEYEDGEVDSDEEDVGPKQFAGVRSPLIGSRPMERNSTKTILERLPLKTSSSVEWRSSKNKTPTFWFVRSLRLYLLLHSLARTL